MTAIYIDYLNALDIEALAMTDAQILDAVEAGLVAQGNGQTVIEPRVHLEPDPDFHGHFNVLRGYVAPLDVAGVKSSATMSTIICTACRRNSAFSTCSIRAPACRAPFWMPP